jgi:hypothetical protein
MNDATGDRDSGIASVVHDSAVLKGLRIAQPAESASHTLTSVAALAAAPTGGADPPARYAQMMASDGQRVIMFGGAPTSLANGTSLDDTWTFGGGTWTQWSPS